MKKIFYSLVLFASLFIFSGKVDAMSCRYYNKAQNIEFTIDDTVAILQNDISVDGKSYSAGTAFGKGAALYGGAMYGDTVKSLYNMDTKKDVQKSDTCLNYMFFDAKGGKHMIYFSNSETIAEDYDVVLKMGEPYTEGKSNVRLNEMVCTYAYPGTDHPKGLIYKSITFVITDTGYDVLGNFKKLSEKKTQDGFTIDKLNFIDHYDLRIFKTSSGMYSCPPGLSYGYDEKVYLDGKDTKIEFSYIDIGEKFPGFIESFGDWSATYDLVLQSSSYIDAEPTSSKEGETYIYYREGSTSDKWDISLKYTYYDDGESFYTALPNGWNNISFDNLNIIYAFRNDVEYLKTEMNLPAIYTNCLTTKNTTCTISDMPFEPLQSSDGTVEKFVPNEERNDKTGDDAEKGMATYTGAKFKSLMCELHGKLDKLPNSHLINPTNIKEQIKVYNNEVEKTYYINNLDCSSWGYNGTYTCPNGNCDNIKYYVNTQIRDVKNYCNNIYNIYLEDKTNTVYSKRKDECLSFEKVYQNLVQSNIIEDQADGCGFISTDLKDKLIWILDLIKIIGPIAAVFLGMLDFVKAVVSGDPDKEMKTAFNRLKTRLIAAVLLFIIPLILAFALDLFLENEKGYNKDNPFCNLVDWEE